MKYFRPSEARGMANHGWLKSAHTFSFSEYYDPAHMGFSALRVINEDHIAGGGGFPTHPHRDMEIITFMVEGALEHADTLGNRSVILPGEVQHMSAGTGIRHSEFNHHKDKKAHLLQIWILPDRENYAPGYGQKDFSADLNRGDLFLLASKDGADGSIRINQSASLYGARAKEGKSFSYALAPGRKAWVQLVKGSLDLNGQAMKAGDGIGLSEEERVEIKSKTDAEFLLFDLP